MENIQNVEGQEQEKQVFESIEKPIRKRRPIKKPKMRKDFKPKVPPMPLGLSIEPTAKAPEIKKTTMPWKPARITEIPENLKDHRFVYRQCNTQKTGNIQKKLQEGWEIDHILSKKLNELYGLTRTLQDGSPMDSTFQIRELIVMRMPKEMAHERNEYYRKRSSIDRKSIERGMRDNLNEESDPSNILGRSTIYSERKLERI